tara:strand:- start:188 stop:961 length:774 start_codon:yes stop_codon:yes gene_type:complete
MSEEQQQAEAQEADAPLINVSQEQEQEAEAEAPVPVHEDAEPDPQELDDDEAIDRPDYYPEKFWDEDGPDVEKLAKSYAELEKAFRSGKHKAPEGDYEVSDLVDRGLDLEDPAVEAYQQWAKQYGISQKAFEDLAGTILEMNGEADEFIEYDQRAELQKLGANAQEKISFVERNILKADLNQSEKEALSMSLNSADSINALTKIIQGYTNENIPIKPVVAEQEMTESDLAQAIADPRWMTDPVWRTRKEKQWMAANN